jgi:hypothetical protein
MRTHIPTLILLAGLALPARGLRAAAETEKVPPEKAPAAVEERIAALEKRIQALEQAMVEKDARIADLQRRLNEAPQGPGPGLPGLRFQLNPQDLQRFQEQIQKYMQDGLDGFPGLGEDNLIPAPGAPEERPRWLRPRDLLPAQKPRLGVSLQDANAELMERYKNKVERGAFVTQVLPDTPAEKAGVLTGDCVVSFDHKPIEGAQDLMDTIKAAPEGKHQLVIKRRGEDLGLNVTLGPLIEMPQRVENGWIRGRRDRAANAPREVVEVRVAALELTPQLADALKLDEKQRAKMEAVLAAHAKKLSAEYTEKIGAGGAGRFTLSDKALQPLVDKHAAEAETELRDTLTEAQLKTWRDYRARHRGVSISRNLQIEPEEQKATPEGLNF